MELFLVLFESRQGEKDGEDRLETALVDVVGRHSFQTDVQRT